MNALEKKDSHIIQSFIKQEPDKLTENEKSQLESNLIATIKVLKLDPK